MVVCDKGIVIRGMINIWLAFLAITAILSFKRTVYGCCCLLVSRILIPECVRLTPIVDISLNTCVIALLICFLMRDLLTKNKRFKDIIGNTYTKILLGFMLAFLVVLPFSETMDVEKQRGAWTQFLITDIIPTIIFIACIKKKEDLIIVLKTLLVVSLVNCLYGCLTIIIGSNPYVFIINMIYSNRSSDLNTFDAMLGTRGGILTTSSTFQHPNGWGYFLPITFVLFFYLLDKQTIYFSKKILWIVLLLLSVGVIICGKRSAYVAYMVFWIVYFFISSTKDKMRLMKYALFGFVLFILLITILPQLENIRGILESSIYFWDDKRLTANEVGGSSWELRVRQLFYPWVEVSHNIFLGHGFGWCATYLKEYALHPILYGFETIFSTAVCEGGIFGTFMWTWLFVRSYKYSALHSKRKKWERLFSFTQIVIAIATGFGYFIFYGIYITIISKFYLLDENISSNRNI